MSSKTSRGLLPTNAVFHGRPNKTSATSESEHQDRGQRWIYCIWDIADDAALVLRLSMCPAAPEIRSRFFAIPRATQRVVWATAADASHDLHKVPRPDIMYRHPQSAPNYSFRFAGNPKSFSLRTAITLDFN
ncbi:hypothetical protein B0H13DRAFT_2362925 [Mycena leptocephala]|nr:hypothetical protein B0H13DRAFT_2362925 [Mycena leptocephala]